MAIFYKCDKCGKSIKGEVSTFSFSDVNKKFFDKLYNRFEFCEECAKPLAGLVKKSLIMKNKK